MARTTRNVLSSLFAILLALAALPTLALAEMAEEVMGEESATTGVTVVEGGGSSQEESSMGEAPVATESNEVKSNSTELAPQSDELAPETTSDAELEPEATELEVNGGNAQALQVQAISQNATSVCIGLYHSAAIKSDGSLWTWGYNNNGQLGDGTTTNRSRPAKIMDDVAAVSLGASHSAAIKSDGSLWMWGNGYHSQIGDGTTTTRYTPIKVMDNVVAVSLGAYHSAAVKSDGSLWTWGYNYNGQLGDGTTNLRAKPVKVMDSVVSVSATEWSTAAIKSDGSLWTWGGNYCGSLGDGTTVQRNRPVKVMDGAVAVSVNCSTSAAIKSDGSLWMWGDNSEGQFGSYVNGVNVDYNRPTKITTGIAAVSLGEYNTAVIKTDGSLWTWGRIGRIESGNVQVQRTPVKMMDNAASLMLGYVSSAAVKTDGSLWTWGLNDYGHLGDGTTTDRNTPVKIMDGVAANGLPIYPTFRDGVDWSPVYDPTYYAAQNPDVANWAKRSDGTVDGTKLLQHFVSNGAKEGRRSKDGFDLASYFNANADLRAAFGGTADLSKYYRHYATNGHNENRKCSGVGSLQGSVVSRDGVNWSPVYDRAYYAQQNTDVANWATRKVGAFGSVLDDFALLQHFVNNGAKEGRRSKASFDLASYFNANADLRTAFGGTTDLSKYYRHYATNGHNENRVCSGVDQLRGSVTKRDGIDWSPVYDRAYYARYNGDVVTWATRSFNSGSVVDDVALLQHFVNNGAKEGRRSKDSFELASYYNANADLRRAFGTDWARYYRHYVTNGQGERRTCKGVGQLRGFATASGGVDWAYVYDANEYASRNADLANWARRSFNSGSVLDDAALLSHFVNNGQKERRQAKSTFNVNNYRNRYADLRSAFGENWPRYYRHFCTNGHTEGRNGA